MRRFMPWPVQKLLTMKEEFVTLAQQPGTNFRELCRRYQISPVCGYKWLRRYETEGPAGLQERSRRPRGHPKTTSSEIEQRILELRQQNPAWGGRKVRRRLLNLGIKVVPAASTMPEILRRRGLLGLDQRLQGPWQRFEHSAPNELWQMDFKAPLRTLRSGVCHPLTLLDDHSRFALQVEACADQKLGSLKGSLQELFERYGLPRAILCDNGTPWRGSEPGCRFTSLGVWLLQVGVEVWHGRPLLAVIDPALDPGRAACPSRNISVRIWCGGFEPKGRSTSRANPTTSVRPLVVSRSPFGPPSVMATSSCTLAGKTSAHSISTIQ